MAEWRPLPQGKLSCLMRILGVSGSGRISRSSQQRRRADRGRARYSPSHVVESVAATTPRDDLRKHLSHRSRCDNHWKLPGRKLGHLIVVSLVFRILCLDAGEAVDAASGEPVDHRGCEGWVSEHAAPAGERQVRSEDHPPLTWVGSTDLCTRPRRADRAPTRSRVATPGSST
jgi:hypothetical protein